ncbi:uncharacterized protein DUF3152 [Tamaricihabitans halophyticus]|uniref:Uncharacterized protein DUF3152 n=1 Tax=Tamaricihabitans halophyticus TaxID=1262583 RepID=A0A4R2QJ34_9PSEU|nr:DUF3152 domain-containing protein [Tamaricihabitans halophyticus]TCP49267.1 uncharacterized protein DUF3152 [Tamaricihabitans halophyticus]
MSRPRQPARRSSGPQGEAGEPLRASWRPAPREASAAGGGPPKKPNGWRRFAGTYGWRVYALPILLVVTVLVGVDTATTGDESGQQSAESSVGPQAEGPQATERRGKPANLNIPTAELPDGAPYTSAGNGTWRIVPGTSEPVGKGSEEFTYTVEIEDGLNEADYGGDEAFAQMVDGTLANEKSWIGDGSIKLRRVDASGPDPDFRVSLTSHETTKRADVCGFSIPYPTSCWRSSSERVVINHARWVRGAEAFGSDMLLYRQYAINHEVGHALGNNHEGCKAEGDLAPVMMQQTFGVANDYVAKLNTDDPINRQAVPKDGKTCRPNAWPVPGSRPSS